MLVADEVFRGKGKRIVQQGWRRVDEDITRKEKQLPLPAFEKGQSVDIDTLLIQNKETQPPKPYSDGTLISAMENVARKLEDKALKQFLKSRGLGTPATRAEIIEKLIRTQYIQRNRKYLEATKKGIDLIGVVVPKLKDPQLTAEWEQHLFEIEENKLTKEAFMEQIKRFISDIIPEVFKSDILEEEENRLPEGTERLGTCPKCGKGAVIISQKAFGCSRWKAGCDFKIWKVIASKTISKTQAKKIIKKGESDLIKGFKSKKGSKFDTVLKLDEDCRVVFSFPERKDTPKTEPVVLGDCPKCSEGQIIEGKKGYGCDQWRNGCKFVIWKHIAGKTITKEIAEELLINGQTGLLDGFMSREERPFSACLMFDRTHKVVFGKSED
jgi:DNA topoisomerase-3